jgi:hypothetical protein
MTRTHTWPPREEWEAQERRHALYTIQYGLFSWDFGSSRPAFTTAEQEKVDALAPEAIKMIRRTCSRIERALRQAHPEAGALAHGIHPDEPDDPRHRGTGRCRNITWWHSKPELVRRFKHAVDALTGEARDAYDDLDYLSDVRSALRRGPFDDPRLPAGCAMEVGGTDSITWDWERRWPTRHPLPAAPEVERLRALNDEAVGRWFEENREMGRLILADLDSGVRWQRELEHRARLEEWFARGPIVEVIRP